MPSWIIFVFWAEKEVAEVKELLRITLICEILKGFEGGTGAEDGIDAWARAGITLHPEQLMICLKSKPKSKRKELKDIE